MKVLAFGLGVGVAIQAWRNFPADGPVSTKMAMVAFLVGLVAAYVGGRWHGRGGAVAVAQASAEATAVAANQTTVNFVVTPGAGAGHQDMAVRIPTQENVPWLDGPRAQIDASEVLDGIDPAELAELAGEVEA